MPPRGVLMQPRRDRDTAKTGRRRKLAAPSCPEPVMNRTALLFRTALATAALTGLAACGTVSGLSRESADAPARIADFERVEVLDFGTDEPMDAAADTAAQARHAAQVAQAGREFADKIAAAITADGSFREVLRAPGAPPALRVTGVIHRYDEGNIVARGLTGFAGQSHFDATVTVADAASGKTLATLRV
ncbi:MAG TPA: DUF4410 domain-containing protein, partial [Burkholderiaceae bacterium]